MIKSLVGLWIKRFVGIFYFALLVYRKILPKSLIKFILLRHYKIQLHIKSERIERNVSICKYKYGAKGSLCISVDFEKPPPKQINGTRISHEAVPEILRLNECYDIPMTWGVSGNIVVEDNSRWRNNFEQILSSVTQHDLGSHTFNHKDLSLCSLKDAKEEIVKSIRAFKEKRPITFIFPESKVKHLALLNELGFVAYRGIEAKLGYPTKLCGLWSISQTYYLGRKSSDLAADSLALLLRLLIDLAIEYGCVLHVWSHPWHMSIRGSARRFVLKVLNPLLNYAARKREEKLLWICTMRELANYCESRKNCTILKCKRTTKELSVTVHCEIKNGKFDFPPVVTIKMPIPNGKHVSRVYVDENELRHSINFYVTEHGTESLVLTLTFEKPVKKIRVLMNN